MRLGSYFFDDQGGSYEETLQRTRTRALAMKAILDAPNPEHEGRTAYAAIESSYHRALDAAFGAALTGSPDTSVGRPVARQAEAIVFDQVILPYDRVFGQYKSNNSLLGLGNAAHVEFGEWLEGQEGLDKTQRKNALSVFDRWLGVLDQLRQQFHLDSSHDTRLVWLPMQLAIRPDEHDQQAEIDDIIERLVEQGFTDDNAAIYMSGQQFPFELSRMLRQTRHYHVLWIHDYRGVTPRDARTGWPSR